MCGIAGAFDLEARRDFSAQRLSLMGAAIRHRGPDESGSFLRGGVALHNQRLSIVDLQSGGQPIYNEDQTVVAVFNGEIFNHLELRQELEKKGHQFRSSTDTEVLVHLWEEHGRSLVDHLEGQFALAIYDSNKHSLFLARDPFGVCPLFIHRTADGWLLFASEIKALLASGLLKAELDPRGVDHIFTFFAMGTRRTMFSGVESLPQGHALLIALDGSTEEFQFFDHDFPEQGRERGGDPDQLAGEFGELLQCSVELRLRADVPVVSYLSGGVDSSLVARLAGDVLAGRGQKLETFTIQIPNPRLDETELALRTAQLLGTHPLTITCGDKEIAETYPALIASAETPVIDTSSAALHRLAGKVRECGYKVTLTGEGADEALAGYPWHKYSKLFRFLDRIGLQNRWRKRFTGRAGRGRLPWEFYQQRYQRLGGYHAMSDLYVFCGLSGSRLFHNDFLDQIHRAGLDATADVELPLEKMKQWDPLNRSLYLGYKIMLAGLLMTHKGDRPALAHGVEARFPFLDRELIRFCNSLAPDLKLRGFQQDKFLLRRFALNHLDPQVARRPKHIFRAAYAGSFLNPTQPYVEQLLSEESLKKTGLFDEPTVRHFQQVLSRPHLRWGPHMLKEVGMVGVISTQLWHHLFLGSDLCELSPWSPPSQISAQTQPEQKLS
ncbi:MAG: asparagine synthase (glutamine-hydrolyzing) [Vulcanimicrobiota bacterium]